MYKEYHSQYNDDIIIRIIILIIIIVFAIYLIKCIFVSAYKEITTHNVTLSQSKVINDEMQQTYDICEHFKIDLININDIKNRKAIYDIEELKAQRESIIKTQTEISKKLTPPGTYVYLTEERRAVRVKSLYGYQAMTYEGICFLTCDIDTYNLISYHKYKLFKDCEE